MTSAKANFLNRIKVFKRTLSSSVLQDNGVTNSAHNEKAKILRNGISIIAFTILEDFIKDRTGELIQNISSYAAPFNSLPDKLQKAATIHALKSILNRAIVLQKSNEDWLTFIQTETKHIGSTSSSPFSISKFSLGWDKSNLASSDIPEFMKVLNVSGGWSSIHTLTSNAGVTLIDPEAFFVNAASRRHKAAHDPTANSLYNDLMDFAKDVKSMAFAFDALISQGFKSIIAQNQNPVTPTAISLRFLVKGHAEWHEYVTNFRQIINTDSNFQRLASQARRVASQSGQILVVMENIGEVKDWNTF